MLAMRAVIFDISRCNVSRLSRHVALVTLLWLNLRPNDLYSAIGHGESGNIFDLLGRLNLSFDNINQSIVIHRL